MTHEHGLATDVELTSNNLPFRGSKLFQFSSTKQPEGVLHVSNPEGGILISCDSLQNWESHDEFFSQESIDNMTKMGFFQQANFGPVWMQVNSPKQVDFDFKHVLAAHGVPLKNIAKQAFLERAKKVFEGQN
jgi:hypothetical protein